MTEAREISANNVTTLAGMLENIARASPDRIGARFVGRKQAERTTYTFADLLQRAQVAAQRLSLAGVDPGDRVAIVSPTEVGFYDAFFGALLCGAVPTPVYPPLRLGRFDEWIGRTAQMLVVSGARCVIAAPRSRQLLDEVLARTPVDLGVLPLESLHDPEAINACVNVESPRPDDLALVQFSSGTTRDPAPVALTHRQILANIEAIVQRLPPAIFGGGGCVTWLPLYHDMGLIGALLTSLRIGETLTLIGPDHFVARPAIWLQMISEVRATVSASPSFGYARCVEKVTASEIDALDLSSWVVAMNGAEPISVDAMRAFNARFARAGLRPEALSPVYGLAEAALAVTFSAFDQPFTVRSFNRQALAESIVFEQPGGIELPSLGSPLPGYEVEIRNDDGEPSAPDCVGNIWVRGPSIAHYLGGADTTVDGWLDTGDLGFLLDGELYVCGRARDVVVVRGRNHAAHDIEGACEGAPGARAGGIVAVSELSERGERVHVFVESHEATDRLAVECRNRILSQTGVNPDAIWILQPGTLPRTSSGKLRRRETLARHLSGELAPPGQVGLFLGAPDVRESGVGLTPRD